MFCYNVLRANLLTPVNLRFILHNTCFFLHNFCFFLQHLLVPEHYYIGVEASTYYESIKMMRWDAMIVSFAVTLFSIAENLGSLKTFVKYITLLMIGCNLKPKSTTVSQKQATQAQQT